MPSPSNTRNRIHDEPGRRAAMARLNMSDTSTPSMRPRRQTQSLPLVRVLVIDFSPAQIAALWHAASQVLPAIELRMYCRTHRDLDQQATLADRYDVILVDAAEQAHWLKRLEQPTLRSLLDSTVVISGEEPAQQMQSRLLRAGYVDVVCVLDTHARTAIDATIKAFLRQLRRQHIDLPPAVAAPIQRMLN